MNEAGTSQQAFELAKQRWARMWPFDLPDETWQDLFSQYPPGEVLQAIQATRSTRDRQPAVIFRSLLYWLDKIHARERYSSYN